MAKKQAIPRNKIITGDKLDDVITSLIAEDQARKLAAMDEHA